MERGGVMELRRSGHGRSRQGTFTAWEPQLPTPKKGVLSVLRHCAGLDPGPTSAHLAGGSGASLRSGNFEHVITCIVLTVALSPDNAIRLDLPAGAKSQGKKSFDMGTATDSKLQTVHDQI